MINQWAVGPVVTFTIPNGANGSGVTAVDLAGNYKVIVVKCADCQYIAATTGLTAKIGYTGADTVCDLYEQNDPSTKWSKANLPTSGTLAFHLAHATGARRVQLILSNSASGGDVVFEIQGLDRGN